MANHTVRIAIVVSVVSLIALTVRQHQTIVELRNDVQSSRDQQERLRELSDDNADGSTPEGQIAQPENHPISPSSELLRLRGEVGLLRREHNEIEQMRIEIIRLRQELRAIHGPTFEELFNIDTANAPKIEMGATKDEVLSELQRVGAKILDENEPFIHALLFKGGLSDTNPVTLELHFIDGKLATHRLIPRDFRKRTPSPFE